MSHLNGPAPVKILHVVGMMNRGGAETWLMNVLRNIDRSIYHMDFLVHNERTGAFDDEIERLGSRVVYCAPQSHPAAYAQELRRINRLYGPYDVIHSHVHHFSGYAMVLAKVLNIPIRIVHSLTDTRLVDSSAGPLRKMYLQAMSKSIDWFATHKFAVSTESACALYGADSSQVQILPCGIDLEPFKVALEKIRPKPEHRFVIGHVGRMVPEKNHDFMLKIMKCVLLEQPNAKMLFIGDGPLRSELETKATQTGLNQNVAFLGDRFDVADLLVNEIDVFLFPSLWEGLPLALIEAQAAGLNCVISDSVTKEVDVFPDRIIRVAIQSDPSHWADCICRTKLSTLSTSRFDQLAGSPYNIDYSVDVMTKAYCDGDKGITD